MKLLAHSRRIILILSTPLLVIASGFGLLLFGYMPHYQVAHEPIVSTSSYLTSEEVVLVPASAADSITATSTAALPVEPVLFEYVEVIDGCGPHFTGECLNARSGPGTDFPVVRNLRNGIVLKVGGMVEREGDIWYQIVFDEWLRYPERVVGDWYVRADFVAVLYDEGDKTVWDNHEEVATSTKHIVVDRSEQRLYAYDDGQLFMATPISTGLELTPTPRGTFTVFKKTPSRYMQGPLPGLADQQEYDLPGVPWNLYFTQGGAVIHGAYWHEAFGSQYSHGCVNLPPAVARTLYGWADLGMTVEVRD